MSQSFLIDAAAHLCRKSLIPAKYNLAVGFPSIALRGNLPRSLPILNIPVVLLLIVILGGVVLQIGTISLVSRLEDLVL